jgi:hypothetical protein
MKGYLGVRAALVGVVGTLATVGLVSYSRGVMGQPAGRVHRLAGGLQVEVLEPDTSDVSRILGIKTWKFKVTPPKPSQMIVSTLEYREAGKPARVISGLGSGPFKDGTVDVVIGMQPVGDSWSKSEKVKCAVMIGPGNGAGNAQENLFRKYPSMASGPGELQKDGSFLLMTGCAKKPVMWPNAEWNEASLALVVQVKDVKWPR